ncbi:VOC family protein [Hydrogenophaga sp.]|uniref:VOC family protein n=1 Tax=Hydrogenophaga sp. TaxID=1904254 RepID=UPI00260A2305|nr:VOC family protein [Hydrogenophaga sp.]MCW5653587.1 VOC family protein [Hydrogenophaga sp.]
MNACFSFFCRDMDAQFRFYQAVLGMPERVHERSPIYRSMGTDAMQIGLHAEPAYVLLDLGNRAPADDDRFPVTAYPTFFVEAPERVDDAARRTTQTGGSVIKGPYATYYGHWQVVVQDPESHVFRISCTRLPAGVLAPALVHPV